MSSGAAAAATELSLVVKSTQSHSTRGEESCGFCWQSGALVVIVLDPRPQHMCVCMCLHHQRRWRRSAADGEQCALLLRMRLLIVAETEETVGLIREFIGLFEQKMQSNLQRLGGKWCFRFLQCASSFGFLMLECVIQKVSLRVPKCEISTYTYAYAYAAQKRRG